MWGRLLILGFLAFGGSASLRADDVITRVDELVRLHLPYVYGSEDLRNGGLDCSGFVQIVFRETCGIELPNEADKQLDYCRQHGHVWDATSDWTPETLQPGDLIFFAGPYDLPRESRVTHVMVYCGNDTMAGAQGEGHQENGVFGGVGYYYFHPHYPKGMLGESGERFIGHRHIFAYGRVNAQISPVSQESLALVPKASPVKRSTSEVMASKTFGISSHVD
jgi:hypothetical protein